MRVRPHPSIFGRGLAFAAVLGLLLAACAGPSSPSPAEPSPSSSAAEPSPSSSAAAPAGPIPLVIDNDMSLDDLMAIAFLTTRPDVELRAITVTGTGIAHCGPGARNASDLLNELQATAVPTACGSAEPIAGGLAFPEEWRVAADGLFGLKVASAPWVEEDTAVGLLTQTIGQSDRPVTILATGPLTNLAQALDVAPQLAEGIARIVIMGGAVDVDGNASVDGIPAPAEWNFAADPSAAATVLRSGIPITLVALDATNDVPITRAFADTLHQDVSAGPANLVDELLLRNSTSVGVDYFWDVLAAMTLVDPAVVTTEETHVSVAIDGPEAGRTTRADDGALVALATGADAPAFETTFLEGLRAGGPRQSSFEVTGELKIAFDGTTCSADAPEMLAAGTYLVSFTNDSDVPVAAVVGGLVEGSTYDDLDAWTRDHPGSIDQPPMVVVHGAVYQEPGQTGTGLAELVPGDGFVVCLVAATGQERVVDSARFPIK